MTRTQIFVDKGLLTEKEYEGYEKLLDMMVNASKDKFDIIDLKVSFYHMLARIRRDHEVNEHNKDIHHEVNQLALGIMGIDGYQSLDMVFKKLGFFEQQLGFITEMDVT